MGLLKLPVELESLNTGIRTNLSVFQVVIPIVSVRFFDHKGFHCSFGTQGSEKESKVPTATQHVEEALNTVQGAE
jgi:hypothetical protein